MPIPLVRQLARRMTTALSLLASGAAMIAVLTIPAEARADAPKQGASTAQVLAQESKPMPNAAPQPGAKPRAKAKPHPHANANAKAQPHPKAKAKPKPSAKPGAKPSAKPAKAVKTHAPAPAKPAKPGSTARV
jgi:hypothetical protein